MKNKVGHISSTILNSCSFQRYRPLSVKASSFFRIHPLVTNKDVISEIKASFPHLELGRSATALEFLQKTCQFVF